MRFLIALMIAMVGFAAAGSARAQVDIASPETIHGVVDLRLAAVDGEPSFYDGGFGKLRYGADDGSAGSGTLQLANAALEWTPRWGWEWSAVVDVLAQAGQEHVADIGQGYIVYKPVPRSATRFTARAGVFYPPISLENDARAWGVTDTITPSAINTWVGEELKVAGLEATVTRDFGDQEVGATVGVFGYDDTSGTLLAFRGWALQDVQSQANGSFVLPPLSPFIRQVQDTNTYSTLDIDHRPGYYARLDWRPTPRVALNAFYYDNVGDRVSMNLDQQWAWATRFAEFGVRWDPDDKTRILGQALSGNTQMGLETPGGRYVDMDFRSAYLSATRLIGKSALTARFDLFDTHDNSAAFLGDTNERGWAITAAWRYPLTRLVDWRIEALRVDSDRPGRALAMDAPHQAQTELQSSLRLTF